MEIQKILIIRNDHIGDLVLSSAVFREIKKVFPNASITLIANKLNKPLIEKNPYIDEIWELDIAQYSLKCILKYFKMAMKIRKEKFDAGIDLRGSIMNSFFLLLLSGIKKRISRTDAHPIISLLLTKPVKIKKETHATEDNLMIINEGLSINATDRTLEIITDKEDEKEIKKFLKENNIKKYVCMCPVAGLEHKQWKLENWMDLIKNFKYKNYEILLLGTEKEREIFEKLGQLNKKCRIFTNFNLRLMSLLFKKSKLVITQDGGPMHIAWVSNANLIELHNLFIYGMNKVVPLNKAVVLYTKGIDMNSISVEQVQKEINKILK